MNKQYFNSKGKNAEHEIYDLATKSFFMDWCYLNPILPDGKELCDLLVVFDGTAIIWQIKHLKIRKNGKYNPSEIEKNIRQLSGAKRKLLDLNTILELKNPRRGIEKFDPSIIKKVYLISLILGEGEDVYKIVDYVKKHPVHIFTGDFTNIILSELDTMDDFVKYLSEKESFIEKVSKILIFGDERGLLVNYLMNNRSLSIYEKGAFVTIDSEIWDEFIDSEEYKVTKKKNEISYFWDHLINFAHETGSEEYEFVARELARSNRYDRLVLSRAFYGALRKSNSDLERDTFRRVFSYKRMTYCFLFLDESIDRNIRKSDLMNLCYVARGTYKDNEKVIGIATEKKILPECSYDYCLLDFPVWGEEEQKEMEEIHKKTGILSKPVIKKISF